MNVLRQLGFKRAHHRELLPGEHLDEKVNRAREHHRLLLEVLDVRPLRQKLRHIADLMSRLFREHVARPWQNRRPHKHRHIRQSPDELLHQGQILCPVILRRNMNLQERDINPAQVIVVPLRRIADKDLHILVILLKPCLEGSADEAAANNPYFYHLISMPFFLPLRFPQTTCYSPSKDPSV